MVAYFFGIRDSPVMKSMLQAIRPVVVGLLLFWTAYDMAGGVFAAKKLGWTSSRSHRRAGTRFSWSRPLSLFSTRYPGSIPFLLFWARPCLGFLVYR